VPSRGVPDVVKVVDFGLVKDLETDDSQKLSHADALTGTPLYMPPEAITPPDTIDGRADLYALGAVAWFLLVGRPPFESKTLVEVCAKHVQQAPEPPSRFAEAVPRDLEAVVMRLLEKDPAARLQSATELEDALASCECATRWSRAQAEAWWRDHAGQLGELRRVERPTDLTIHVVRS